jgi:hypothetical protein
MLMYYFQREVSPLAPAICCAKNLPALVRNLQGRQNTRNSSSVQYFIITVDCYLIIYVRSGV